MLRIREALEYEKEAISGTYSALWKDKSLRKRMLLAVIVNAGQQITGQGSLNTYSTKIYQKVFPSAGQIALINALNATFGIIFTLNAVWIIDRFGRKFLLIIGGIGMGICMIIVSAVETETPSPNGVKTQPVGISIVFLLFLFIFFCKILPIVHFEFSLTSLRQAFVGSYRVDLDIRDLLDERSRTSCGNGVTDSERREYHLPAILPYLPQELWVLRLLYVCWCQLPPGCFRVLLHPRDEAGAFGRDRCPFWWREPCHARRRSHRCREGDASYAGGCGS